MTRRTKEERFVVCLFEEGGETSLDTIGQLAGLTPRNLKQIARDLANANFIKKRDEGIVFLTPRGVTLAKELLES